MFIQTLRTVQEAICPSSIAKARLSFFPLIGFQTCMLVPHTSSAYYHLGTIRLWNQGLTLFNIQNLKKIIKKTTFPFPPSYSNGVFFFIWHCSFTKWCFHENTKTIIIIKKISMVVLENPLSQEEKDNKTQSMQFHTQNIYTLFRWNSYIFEPH